jgi:hypothetical protein
MTPARPGTYLYTPDLPGADPVRIVVIDDAGVLRARLVDEEGDVELHAVDDISGTWSPT